MAAGRPVMYGNDARVSIHATGKTRLQAESDRRAIINILVDNGGVMTVGDINRHFGFDIRAALLALQRSGWLQIEAVKK